MPSLPTAADHVSSVLGVRPQLGRTLLQRLRESALVEKRRPGLAAAPATPRDASRLIIGHCVANDRPILAGSRVRIFGRLTSQVGTFEAALSRLVKEGCPAETVVLIDHDRMSATVVKQDGEEVFIPDFVVSPDFAPGLHRITEISADQVNRIHSMFQPRN